MKENKIKALIIVMTLAVMGLLALQIIWSLKTIDTEKIRFDSVMNEILSNVISKIEKNRTANVLIDKVAGDKGKTVWVENHSGEHDSNKVMFFISNTETQEIISDEHNITINLELTKDEHKEDNVHEEHDTSNMRILKKVIKHKSHDENLETIEETVIDTIVYNKQKLVLEVLEDMVSFNKDVNLTSHLDKQLIDSLLNIEFLEYGYKTEFYFGVKSKNDSNYVFTNDDGNNSELSNSKYFKSLSPREMFSNSLILYVHIPKIFPLIIKSVWVMFALSLLFISIIIFVYIKTIKVFLQQKKVAEVKNDLVNNITHEFKTPISAISLASEALTEPKLLEQKDSVKKFSHIIYEENQKLNKLVETLLNTATYEKGEIELKLEKVLLDEELIRIFNKAKEQNTDTSFIFKNDCTEPIEIDLDLFHFTNVINNLIDNAIKYSKDENEITLSLNITNGVIVISVADCGIGISKKNQRNIFDTFFRVQTGDIHDVKGNGIGLSYVKKIVEAHSGRINVKSKLNVGSTFIIYLPYDK